MSVYLENKSQIDKIFEEDVKEFGYSRVGHMEDFSESVRAGIPGLLPDQLSGDPEFLKVYRIEGDGILVRI